VDQVLPDLCRGAAITPGPAGATVADGATARLLPAMPVAEVVDTTGAGDAFAGALAASLARGEDLDAAVAAGLAPGPTRCSVLEPDDVASSEQTSTPPRLVAFCPTGRSQSGRSCRAARPTPGQNGPVIAS
jgi:sugar/nucleoside kinase (ribokinase family)